MAKVYVLAIWKDEEYLSFSINNADVAIATYKDAQAQYDVAYLYVTDASGRMERVTGF